MTRRLQAIIAVSALMLTAACASADPPPASPSGSVTGKLVIEGGPISQRPIPGTVQFTAHGRPSVTVRTDSSGTFSVTLPAGTYDVSGSSPSISGANGQAPCSRPLSVAVTSKHTTTITLICIVP